MKVAGKSTGIERSSSSRFEGEEFDDLYRKHRPALLTYARRRNAVDAELVVDLALFDFYRARDRLRSDNVKVYWAYMYRAVDSHLARERGRPLPALTPELDDLEDVESFEQILIDHMSFEDTLSLLTPSQADAIRLQMVEGMTSVQAGKAMGRTPAAVRQLQHQAVIKLRRLLFGIVMLLIVVGGLAVAFLAVDSAPTENAPTDAPVDSTPSPDVDRDDLGIGDATRALRVDIDVPADAPADAPVGQPDGESSDDVDPAPALPSPVAGEVGVMFANIGSGECLDAGVADLLIQWGCHGDSQQRFVADPVADGDGFFLRRQEHDLCLDASAAGLRVAGCDGTPNQVFIWAGTELRTNSGACLTIDRGSLDNQRAVVAAPCDGSPAQQFFVFG